MSATPHPPDSPVAIPDSLRRQLEDFRRHLWRVKVLEAVAAGFIGLLLSFLLVYGLDRVGQTPGIVRLGILIGGTSLFVLFAPYWLHRWVWRHRRESDLARLIARRYPGLGDRLLGVIELQSQREGADTLSPRLRAAAMEAVAAESGRRELTGAMPPQRHRRWGLAVLGLAVCVTLAFTITPRAGLNALQRWLMPLSDTERYTFTRLDSAPSYLAVPFGESFDITLRLAKDSDQRPAAGTGRYGLQPEISAALENGRYVFTFPGQQDPGRVVFRVGDLRHEVRVEPVQRPATEAIAALVRPPAYLQLPERSVNLNTGVLSAVEGSEVRITLTTNRPLERASFGPIRAETADPGEAGGALPLIEGELLISGREASTPGIAVGALPMVVPFEWTDSLGLAGGSGFSLRIDGLRDMPPNVYLQGIDRQKVMLPEETVDFEVLAEDDFGIRGMGIEWSGEFTRPTDETPARGEMSLAEGRPDGRRILEPAAFSPGALGIAPQKLTLRGYTEDYFPDRERVYSDPVTIYVLTRDEHAQLLKSQFDRAITELEDLARRELNEFEENQRLEKLEGEELQNEENRRRLEAQEQAEAENTRRMEELTERMEELLKDAARNGDIDKETMQKMAEALRAMQELSSQDMPEVRDKLGDAQEQSNTPEKAEQDLAEAVEKQQEVLEKMQEAVEKANDANRRFEAGTFVNRLKKAAQEQNGIASSLIEAFNRILGSKSGDLDPADVRRLSEATRQQGDTASDVRWIQEDLGHYFNRTEESSFREILEAMRESQIDIGLDDVRNHLTTNHSFMATEGAKKWADKLSEWAAKLEGELGGGGMGGGGGGGSPPSEDEDFEFMLRVMGMIQQEQDLRGRTRVLEQLRRSVSNESTESFR
jgi:hypothetical protein